MTRKGESLPASDPPPESREMRPHRILIIDDNPQIHNDFKSILMPTESPSDLDHIESQLFGSTRPAPVRCAYDLEFAAQGQEGLELVSRAVAEGRPYAVAFVDMRMPPGWDGLETVGHILEVDTEIQVVLCTAYSDYSWDEIAAHFPDTDSLLILRKPFGAEEVAQMARALTKKWSLARLAALRMGQLEARVDSRTEALRQACRRLEQDILERERAQQERGALEDQLRQAQRIESVGQLAGGIAHDFNNLLTPIVGYTEMILTGLASGDPMSEQLEEVLKAALHARDLTRQLLAYGRKQVLDVRVLNLNDLLWDFSKMLGRLIGEDIELVLDLEPFPENVSVDPSQFHQVVVNLAVNARDAMPLGGTLTLRTRNAQLDEAFCLAHPDVQPGNYALFAAYDTGCGMDAEIIDRIFDPFFTTKQGGTGMGLATAYGIVRQHGGIILAESLPGQGTTFTVYLPESTDKPEAQETFSDAGEMSGGKTVLVVEDEEAVRRCVCWSLQSKGYEAIGMSSPYDAISAVEKDGQPIDILLTDVVLPEMSGPELYERLRVLRPHLPVLYMSGYPHGKIAHHGILDTGACLLPKPFTAAELAQKLREVLALHGMGPKPPAPEGG
jgi:signal transduction histidine kinase